eukprot:5063739-Prymnesium_polylepis.1
MPIDTFRSPPLYRGSNQFPAPRETFELRPSFLTHSKVETAKGKAYSTQSAQIRGPAESFNP